jgi:hypothetical protein
VWRESSAAVGPRSSLIVASFVGPFHATVPTLVVIRAVAIFFTVRLIMFLVVADQVAQRKTIVCGDEIQTRARAAAVM